MSNLPGFLRRTLRSSFSSDDDDNDDDKDHESTKTKGSSTGGMMDNTSSSLLSTRDSHPEPGLVTTVTTVASVAQETTRTESISKATVNLDGGRKQTSTAAADADADAAAPAAADAASSSSLNHKPQTYREVQFAKVMSASVVNLEELRKLAWNGIPHRYRSLCWKLLLGYVPTNVQRRPQTLQRRRVEYQHAIAQHYDMDDDTRTTQEQETLRQVLVDVPRTAPEVPLFRNERIRRLLTRLLYIWAMRHPASSYVQGINDLATPLIVVFLSDYYGNNNNTNNLDHHHHHHRPYHHHNYNDTDNTDNYAAVLDGHVMNQISDEQLQELEADVYGCLTNLLAAIQDHYTTDQPGVQRMVMRLEELVNRIDGDLTLHFAQMGILFIQFAFKWMNCLLLREFQLPCIVRLWDTYLSEQPHGFENFHVYVCAAFLCQFSAQLQQMNFDDLFAFMQDIPTNDWGNTEIEMLLSQAYVLSTLFGGSDAHLTAVTIATAASTNPNNKGM